MTLTPSDIQALVTAFIAAGAHSNDLLYKIQLANEREAELQKKIDAFQEGTARLTKQRDEAQREEYRLRQRVATLEGMLKSIPPTLSKAQYDEVQEDAKKDELNVQP